MLGARAGPNGLEKIPEEPFQAFQNQKKIASDTARWVRGSASKKATPIRMWMLQLRSLQGETRATKIRSFGLSSQAS